MAKFTPVEKLALLQGRASKKVYQRYYRTAHWRKTLAAKLELHPFCAMCGRAAKQAHHIHYASLFKENLVRDLVSLCKNCHRKQSR